MTGADRRVADKGCEGFLIARQAVWLIDLICHIAQVDDTGETLRAFARSVVAFHDCYPPPNAAASVSSLSEHRARRRSPTHPEGARRAVAYIRESTEEQGRGYSPDGQRQAIARYAQEHGLALVDEYLDFETGREADKRAGFQRLIEDAMTHSFECVLVFHTSRFARNTIEAKRYKKLLRSELGIDVISVTQPLGADVDDPASFLSESVHEIFDEYYSVSLSFWTKMGLREKARKGMLTGSLPWGLIKGEDDIAVPDPEKAPHVLLIFELYATGQHTDRTIAEWLNVQGQRTTRGRPFCADTVRDMFANAAYCGYVSAQRDRSKAIKGLHEAIVPEELFDRVQGLRRQRARALKPGRPSTRYLLRGLARCRRCNARMQGTAVGAHHVARYYCATRRTQHACDQPLVPAEEVERQLTQFIIGFAPDEDAREDILRRLAAPRHPRRAKPPSAARRSKSVCAGCATSTNSATSSAPSTQHAAPRSTPSWPRSPPTRSPTSTKPARCSKTSRSSGSARPSPRTSATSYR
jgi:DNA invertase Pin-like site-specific DNA recombinase